MGFIRVRARTGPRHEFDISEAQYNRDRKKFTVLDRKPVGEPRPVKYVPTETKSDEPQVRRVEEK